MRGAGKTTLANIIGKHTNYKVIHTDDYILEKKKN